MKYTNIFAILGLVLVLTAAEPTKVFAQEESVLSAQVAMQPSLLDLTRKFTSYLYAVVELNYEFESSVAFKNVALSKVKSVDALCSKINHLFQTGAFAQQKQAQLAFYFLLDNINIALQEWPTPFDIRRLNKDCEDFKNFIFALYYTDIQQTTERALNALLVDSVVVLTSELRNYIFTNNFFRFSLLEKIVDFSIYRPVEFVIEHPLIVVAGVGIIVGGVLLYRYASKKTENLNWLMKEDVRFFHIGQAGAQCGVRALYYQWCHSRTNNNAEQFQALASDQNSYNRFAQFVTNTLQEKERERILMLPPNAPQAARNAQPVNLDWIDTDDVNYVINRSLGADKDFEFRFTSEPQVFRENEFNPEELDIIYYRDNEQDRAYASLEEAPEDRRRFCVAAHRGLRYGQENQKKINKFNSKNGNAMDFIINLNEVPVAAYKALQAGGAVAVEPGNEGHYFHIRAIKDSTAKDSVRFIYTDAFDLDIEQMSPFFANIRQYLRPIKK